MGKLRIGLFLFSITIWHGHAFAGPETIVSPAPAKNPVVAPGDDCLRWLRALGYSNAGLTYISKQPETKRAFTQLDPEKGIGYLQFDVTPAMPPFLVGDNHKKIDWPQKGTWAFAGDSSVPHYIDMKTTRPELEEIVGRDNVTQMEAFGTAMRDFVAAHLPEEEKRRLAAQGVELSLDLGEIRVCSTTGCPVHLDWFPREGMVMVIPIYGERTKIFHPNGIKTPMESGHTYASLITAYDR